MWILGIVVIYKWLTFSLQYLKLSVVQNEFVITSVTDYISRVTSFYPLKKLYFLVCVHINEHYLLMSFEMTLISKDINTSLAATKQLLLLYNLMWLKL